MTTIAWATTDRKPPAKERLFPVVSADEKPPDAKLIGKSEVKIGYWTGDAFRVMDAARSLRIGPGW